MYFMYRLLPLLYAVPNNVSNTGIKKIVDKIAGVLSSAQAGLGIIGASLLVVCIMLAGVCKMIPSDGSQKLFKTAITGGIIGAIVLVLGGSGVLKDFLINLF